MTAFFHGSYVFLRSMHTFHRQASLVLFLLPLLGMTPSQGEDLPSLEELRADYLAEREEAIEPLNQFYIQALERLQKQLNRENRVDDALRVLETKRKFEARMAESSGEDLVPEVEAPDLTATAESAGGPADEGEMKDAGVVETFDPVGTVWIWSAPTMRFTFEADGKGFTESEISTVGRAECTWERKGPRTFHVRRVDQSGFLVQFEVLADEDTGVYSNLNGSLFKRMVSRVPTN